MEQVFAVCKNTQECDHEGWQWWIGTEQVSLHLTKEGANRRVQELATGSNKEEFVVGATYEREEEDVYFVKVIPIEQ